MNYPTSILIINNNNPAGAGFSTIFDTYQKYSANLPSLIRRTASVSLAIDLS
jgi:hypothetical protein